MTTHTDAIMMDDKKSNVAETTNIMMDSTLIVDHLDNVIVEAGTSTDSNSNHNKKKKKRKNNKKKNKNGQLVNENESIVTTFVATNSEDDVPSDENKVLDDVIKLATPTSYDTTSKLDLEVECMPFDCNEETTTSTPSTFTIESKTTDQEDGTTKDCTSPTSVMNEVVTTSEVVVESNETSNTDLLMQSVEEQVVTVIPPVEEQVKTSVTPVKEQVENSMSPLDETVIPPVEEQVETVIDFDGKDTDVSLTEIVLDVSHSDTEKGRGQRDASTTAAISEQKVEKAIVDDEEVSLVDVPELHYSDNEEQEEEQAPSINVNESSSSSSSNNPAPPSSMDVASHLYDGIKGVWGWSKDHIPLANIFMGMTEAVASTITRVTLGGNIQETDTNWIKPHLAQLDSGVLNPVLHAILGIVLFHQQNHEKNDHSKKNATNKDLDDQQRNFLQALLGPFQNIFLGRELLKSQNCENSPLDVDVADIAAGL
jgi:hypothetical protein